MSSRAAEETGGVLSFTFLDVLTCTMGTLVLLLVVVGERAKKAVVAEVRARHAAERTDDAPASLPVATAEQLAQLKQRQAELDRVRAEAAEKLRDEQERVSHLEDHHRRLEHQLAQLHFTLERLQETESKQRVDQETADRELDRLSALIRDTEQQIDALRDGAQKKRSYAIVPYKGANGTSRRPIYIECTADAVTIQPEGIRLVAADFDGPIRSGNPLAAAVRAAREDLNARATAAGVAEIDLPDPYPLLLVRPDGAAAYAAALSAIRAWDAEYGYEFVDADWKLEFPQPDAQLGQVMSHAVDQARQRQALLAKVAPRRYGSRLVHGSGAGDGEGDGSGFNELANGHGTGDRIGQNGGSGAIGMGNGTSSGDNSPPGEAVGGPNSSNRYNDLSHIGGGVGGAKGGNFSDEFTPQPGASGTAGENAANATTSAAGGGSGGPGASPGGRSPGQQGRNANSTANVGGNPSPTQGGTSNIGSGAPPPTDVHAASSMAPTNSPAGASGQPSDSTANGMVQLSRDKHSMAETRGANWANAAATQRASAVTRPVKVIVGVDEMRFVPDAGTSAADAAQVSFNQPTDRVMDQLAANIQRQIDDWGLAGRNMYWRPNLVLQVAPGADRQAARLVELLEDSGVDVKLPAVASRSAEESVYAR